jgi:hypothetical protein
VPSGRATVRSVKNLCQEWRALAAGRIPLYLHVYTLVVVFMAMTTTPTGSAPDRASCSRPRFLLPAVLLALPLAKLAAPLRTPVLVGLIAALTVVSTRFGLYLSVITGWAP